MLYSVRNVVWVGDRLKMAGNAEPKGLVIELVPEPASPGQRRLYSVRTPDGLMSPPMLRPRARWRAEQVLLDIANAPEMF